MGQPLAFGLSMVGVIQSELAGNAIDGPGVPLANGVGGPTQLAGDLGPVVPLLASGDDLPFLGSQTAMHLIQELAGGELDAGTRVTPGHVDRGLAPLEPPLVAPRCPMPVGLIR